MANFFPLVKEAWNFRGPEFTEKLNSLGRKVRLILPTQATSVFAPADGKILQVGPLTLPIKGVARNAAEHQGVFNGAVIQHDSPERLSVLFPFLPDEEILQEFKEGLSVPMPIEGGRRIGQAATVLFWEMWGPTILGVDTPFNPVKWATDEKATFRTEPQAVPLSPLSKRQDTSGGLAAGLIIGGILAVSLLWMAKKR